MFNDRQLRLVPERAFSPTTLANEEFAITVLGEGGDIEVVAAGLATALGFRMAADLTRLLPTAEKGYAVVRTPGGDQRVSTVTQAGFFRAIIQRHPDKIRDPELRERVARFQDWAVRDVFPSLFRTGVYDVNAPEAQTPELARLRAKVQGLQAEVVRLQRHSADLQRDCVVLGDQAVPAIGAEYRRGGVPIWFMRDSLIDTAELDLPSHSIMGQLEDLGVIERATATRYKVCDGWHDVLFAETVIERDGRRWSYPYGAIRCRPGQNREFLTRLYIVKQEYRSGGRLRLVA